jgi:polysaccharide export outer membrane protein
MRVPPQRGRLARNEKMIHGLPRLVVAALVALIGIFSSHGAFAQAVSESPSAPQQPSAPVPAFNADSQYLIGPGDSLQVFVWRNPELSTQVPVRPDGRISTPLVEDMVAVGKTPSQLARDMEKVLAEYVRSPQVNIIVTTAQNAFNQIKIVGQVRSPKSIAYRAGMTALDALLEVGGLTEFAAGNRARILRKDATGNQKEMKVKLETLLKKGRASDNPLLQPGDVIMVPEALF